MSHCVGERGSVRRRFFFVFFTQLAFRDELELIQHLNVSCRLQITLDLNRYMMLLTVMIETNVSGSEKNNLISHRDFSRFKEPINIFFCNICNDFEKQKAN